MFDVGDLLVLTFGNCVLKAEWLSGLWNYAYVFFMFFNVFFSKSKKHGILRIFELLHTFSRTLHPSYPVQRVINWTCVMTSIYSLRTVHRGHEFFYLHCMWCVYEEPDCLQPIHHGFTSHQMQWSVTSLVCVCVCVCVSQCLGWHCGMSLLQTINHHDFKLTAVVNCSVGCVCVCVLEPSRQSDWDGIVVCHRGEVAATTWNFNRSTMGSHRLQHQRFKDDHRLRQRSSALACLLIYCTASW